MVTKVNMASMSTDTTGQGTLTLGSARDGFASFADAGVGNLEEVRYLLRQGNDFELGVGTYTSSGTTLSRDTVLLSVISGAAGTTRVDLQAGGATVSIVGAAEDFVASEIVNDSAVAGDDVAGALEAARPGNVVAAIKTDTASITGGSYVDTGLSVTITLANAANRILLMADVIGSTNNDIEGLAFVFTSGGGGNNDILAQGDAAGNRAGVHFVLPPSLNADDIQYASASGKLVFAPGSVGPHTIKLRWHLLPGDGTTGYLNRSATDNNDEYNPRGVSTLTAMEIGPAP